MVIFNKRVFSKLYLMLGLVISGNVIAENTLPSQNANLPSYVNASSVDDPSAVKLNVNQATLDQLMSIKGLGRKKAQAILDYIEVHGDLVSVDELTEVKGIGTKLVKKVKGKLTI